MAGLVLKNMFNTYINTTYQLASKNDDVYD